MPGSRGKRPETRVERSWWWWPPWLELLASLCCCAATIIPARHWRGEGREQRQNHPTLAKKGRAISQILLGVRSLRACHVGPAAQREREQRPNSHRDRGLAEGVKACEILVELVSCSYTRRVEWTAGDEGGAGRYTYIIIVLVSCSFSRGETDCWLCC